MALEQRSPAANAESEVILLYRRPSTNENLLQITELSPATSYEKIKKYANQCGPVSNLWLHESRGSVWANVQFFSALDCARCLRQMNGCTLDQRRLVVRRIELPSASNSELPMRPDQAIMLMNRFFGPMGWSSSVGWLRRQSVRKVEPPAIAAAQVTEMEPAIEASYCARVDVKCGSVSVHGESRALRVAPTLSEALSRASKCAVGNALRAALSQLAILRINGNILLEVIEDPMPSWSAGDAECLCREDKSSS